MAMFRLPADNYLLEFRIYRRKFLRPLVTAHGRWPWREGVIVRLTDEDGRVGYGESAPAPGFTREIMAVDFAWLRRNGGNLTSRTIKQVPLWLLCLRWALSSAQAMMENRLPMPKKITPLPVAALLPAGHTALDALTRRTDEGYHVFKWKVGVNPPTAELKLLEKMLALLPDGGRLRLDANGALTAPEWKFWCASLKALGPAIRAIEFFEQPGMFRLNDPTWAKDAPVTVALDESVTGAATRQNQYLKKWPGPLVVKPSLWGDMDDLLRWRARKDLVYSSVFETSIGLNAILNLAATDVRAGQRAIGLGTLDVFADDGLQLPVHAPGPTLAPANLSSEDLLPLWNRLEKKI